MATRHLKTRPEWEDALRSGLKTIDARLVADDIAGLEVGDIVLYPGAEVRVRHIRFYPGFGDLLAYEDWSRIAPERIQPRGGAATTGRGTRGDGPRHRRGGDRSGTNRSPQVRRTFDPMIL